MKKYYNKNKRIREIRHIELQEKNIYKIYYTKLNVIYINDNFDAAVYESKIIVMRWFGENGAK